MSVSTDITGSGFVGAGTTALISLSSAANGATVVLMIGTDGNGARSITSKPSGFSTDWYAAESVGYTWMGHRTYTSAVADSGFTVNTAWGRSWIWSSYTGVNSVESTNAGAYDPPNLAASQALESVDKWVAMGMVGDWAGASTKHNNLTPSGYTSRVTVANNDVVGGIYDIAGDGSTSEDPGAVLDGTATTPRRALTLALISTGAVAGLGGHWGMRVAAPQP